MPSIGSTSEDRTRPPDLDVAAVLRVERDVAGLGAALLGHVLGDLVDRHRDVAAGRDPDARAGARIAERRRDRVAHPRREIERELLDRAIGHSTLMTATSTRS